MKKSKYCQSCGMPHKKDELGGGTNADGSKNDVFCSHCYQLGEFLNPEIDSAQKMQEFVKDKLIKMGFPCFITGFFTNGIPKLERWKN